MASLIPIRRVSDRLIPAPDLFKTHSIGSPQATALDDPGALCTVLGMEIWIATLSSNFLLALEYAVQRHADQVYLKRGVEESVGELIAVTWELIESAKDSRRVPSFIRAAWMDLLLAGNRGPFEEAFAVCCELLLSMPEPEQLRAGVPVRLPKRRNLPARMTEEWDRERRRLKQILAQFIGDRMDVAGLKGVLGLKSIIQTAQAA